MSWHPDDLVTDADLVAYERAIAKVFPSQVTWQAIREKALEDWLWPLVEQAGYPRDRFRTRYAAESVQGYTGSVYTDLTGAASNATTADLALGTIFAAGTDALYVGSGAKYRGLSWRLLDAVSSTAATLTVQAWCDTWRTLVVTDGTSVTHGKPFSGGGAMIWTVPDGWTGRQINAIGPYYWAKLALSAAPSGATGAQVGVIRRSRLCGPVTLRTLALIYREAPASQDGPWVAKADWYEAEADRSFERVKAAIAGEFDTDASDVVDADEVDQTVPEATDEAAWNWSRR